MKKKLLVGFSIAIMLTTAGCSSSGPQNTPPSNEDDASVVDPTPAPDTPDDDWDAELDENAPEHITRDSISDAVPVSPVLHPHRGSERPGFQVRRSQVPLPAVC